MAYYLPVYMFATLAILLFSGFPVAFVIGGVGLLFGLIGHFAGVFHLIEFYNLVPRIWGGVAENIVFVAVPCFIFMGTMLEKSGVAERLLYCLQVLLRRIPGGMALSVAGMGTVMAATTGIIGASVVMMSLLALPAMLEQRYSRPLAAGTVAASGTLGILIPPSIMLVIMAEMLSVSVGRLFMAAVLPGFLLSLLYIVFICLIAFLRPKLAPPLAAEVGPKGALALLALVLTAFLPPAGLIFLVLGSIFFGWATVTEAAAVGAAGATLLAILNRRLDFRTLQEVVERTALMVAMVFFILLGATAFAYVFRSLGGDFVVIDLIDGLGVGPWGVLLSVMAMIFILGFFFEWIEITLIVLPIFAPVVQMLDFSAHVGSARQVLLWFGILVAVNLQTSFLTPPFGFALFYMKGVAPKEVRMQDIYKGIIPFVLLQLLGLACVIAFPELALWLPRRMLG
jgi:tripartite ATP-independent transporter DctM subunit